MKKIAIILSILFLSSAIFAQTDVNFDAQVIGNDTTDSLDIQVRDSGASGETVRWVATVKTAEVVHA